MSNFKFAIGYLDLKSFTDLQQKVHALLNSIATVYQHTCVISTYHPKQNVCDSHDENDNPLIAEIAVFQSWNDKDPYQKLLKDILNQVYADILHQDIELFESHL